MEKNIKDRANPRPRVQNELFKSFRRYKEENFAENRALSSVNISSISILYLQGAISLSDHTNLTELFECINNCKIGKNGEIEISDVVSIDTNSTDISVIKYGKDYAVIAKIYTSFNIYFIETVTFDRVPADNPERTMLKSIFNILHKSGLSSDTQHSYRYDMHYQYIEDTIEEVEDSDDENEETTKEEYRKDVQEENNIVQNYNKDYCLSFKTIKQDIKILEKVYAKNKDKYFAKTLDELIVLIKSIDWKFWENEYLPVIYNFNSAEKLMFLNDCDELPYFMQAFQYEPEDNEMSIPLPVFFKDNKYIDKYEKTIVPVLEIFDKVIDLLRDIYRTYE